LLFDTIDILFQIQNILCKMKKNCLFLTISLLCSSAIAQTKILKKICNLDGKNYISELIIKNSNPVQANDETIAYLKKIQQISGTTVDCKLVNIPFEDVALSCYSEERNPKPLIIFSKSYYESKFNYKLDKEIALNFVIAHEYAHHANGDIGNIDEEINNHGDPFDSFTSKRMKDIYDSVKKEIVADKKAGWILGTLYPNEPFINIQKILNSILTNETHTDTHPAKRYRIMAVKAGFIEALLQNKPAWKKVTINGTVYYKSNLQDNFITFFEIGSFRYETSILGDFLRFGEAPSYATEPLFNGSIVDIKPDRIIFGERGDNSFTGKQYILYGNGNGYKGTLKFNLKHGFGIFIDKNGGKYIGSYLNNYCDGYGKLYYPTGDLFYDGYWKNDKKNGNGYMYKDGVEILRGCWKDDLFLNKNACK
jgi:hypothetical protein